MAKQLIRFMAIVVTVMILSTCTDYDFDQANTAANQAGFERHFGFPVPETVTELYYYADEFGADVKYQMGFRADQATIARIVSELNLVQRKPENQIHLAQEFGWWDQKIIAELTPYWKSNSDNDYYWYLWYEPESERAYYLEFSL